MISALCLLSIGLSQKTIEGLPYSFENKLEGTFETIEMPQIDIDALLEEDFINILSEQEDTDYAYGHIDKAFLNKNINSTTLKKFYVCGPPPMMESVIKDLKKMGVTEERIVQEAME